MLGLRELQSAGLLPVKKAYVKFRIKSLLPPDQANAIEDVQTEPGEKGPNPNLKTNFQFLLELPKKEIYCPSLECDAFDYIFKGLRQPLIGTFSIPIGDIRK